ncbi:lytic murein transglycosylase [Shewanella avicenniae]|uniref:Lytic murein transglycosylase n=1 Tax=Shewanella avicenniae TaxID=2814294 RepID=A0ABX7QW26_9GAMM|nr:lytic murein transglycosylase [Shewanella avicenniae]QSX35115.1 lytic murein transglycosylase [Shewanella avicenniae]
MCRWTQSWICSAALLLLPNIVVAEQNFSAFVSQLADKAKNSGIDAQQVEQVTKQVKLFRRSTLPVAESSPSLDVYIPAQVTEQKALTAQRFFQQYQAKFSKISQQYGVQPRFILAQWAMLGGFSQQDAATYPLASVAASYAFAGDEAFSVEFIAAVRLIINGGYSFDELVASTDGRLGPLKFSASMLLHCAVDGDGDGKIDIWQNPLDIYASAANCLHEGGWDNSQTWGRQVLAPKALYPGRTGLDHQASFIEWQQLGVRRYDSGNLPKRKDMQVSLIMPDGVKGRKYIVYNNYRVLYQQHPDHYLMLAIAHLSERIKSLGID